MRIAAGVEYDGSSFCGWQTQVGVRTAQDCIEKAVSIVADHEVKVVCAGRTDTGVHSVGQVIHFDSNAQRSMRSWVLGSNANLPKDVCLCWAKSVDERFHARFSAISRHYRYVIINRKARPAVLQDHVTWQHKHLDETLMLQAGQLLQGEHDFSSFRALACQSKTAVRHVYEVMVLRQGEYIYLNVRANGFLHHMVRNIAGVLMAVGSGERPVSWVSDLLSLRDRSQGGVTAPPQGLYFSGVEYDPGFNLPPLPAPPSFS
jgi:tRNA pseudouridine38-40 synthase